MNYKQLTFAREYRGFTQTELAKSIPGLSQSNLSKFEKGLGSLSEESVERIIQFLDFPKHFFTKKISNSIESGHYRKRSAISKTKILQFENKCRLFGHLVDEFAVSIDWPDFKFMPLEVEKGFTPEISARHNRKLLGIKPEHPVSEIFNLLESFGVIIYEIDEDEKFDGVSFFTEKGYPVIIVNRNFSNDRKRFTLAHELGHLILHNENIAPVSSYRDKEAEANAFASEFLMPEKEIKNSLRGLKMADLASLKLYWLTSMSSIIRRAKTLGCIDENRYRYFSIEMSRNGYSKREPVDVNIDKPSCFQNAYKLLKEELSYSIEDISSFTGLPNDIVTEFIAPNSNVVRLKTSARQIA